jgi:transcriptional regulator with XRE-family HTH domain
MDETRIGTAGWVLATNIKRVRTAQRLTFSEVVEMLRDVGREIPLLGLRRIERGERRVDIDDLLALAYVLKISPVDLLVSKDATDEPYPLTPEIEVPSSYVREWIRGEELVTAGEQPGSPFGIMVETLDAVRWMPEDRAHRVAARYFDEEQDQ